VRPDITPGGVFPDYALPDHTGTLRRLSELQGRDPLVLTLARGHYCPKEHQQHLELAAFQAKVAVGCTRIVTIATDDHHTLQEFRASVDDLRHDLRAVTAEIRPDWDLSTPGLAEAWAAGETSRLHGQDRRSRDGRAGDADARPELMA
jgi:hypothetical protein